MYSMPSRRVSAVRDEAQPREGIGTVVLAEPADSPRADHVERAVNGGPLRLGTGIGILTVAAQIAPGGRNAAEDGGRDARRTEIANDRRGLIRGDVAVLERQPPDGDHRLATVEDVGRAIGQVKLIGQVRPILLDGLQRSLAVHAGHIVHYEKAAAV